MVRQFNFYPVEGEPFAVHAVIRLKDLLDMPRRFKETVLTDVGFVDAGASIGDAFAYANQLWRVNKVEAVGVGDCPTFDSLIITAHCYEMRV